MRWVRLSAATIAAAVVVALGAACSSSDKTTPTPQFGWAGTYATEYRWGGGVWNANNDLLVTATGEVYWGTTRILNPTVGTDTVSWAIADGNPVTVNVRFADSSTSEFYWGPGGHAGRLFEGTIQYPGEGGCSHRGVLREAGGSVGGVIAGTSFAAVDFVASIAAPKSCSGIGGTILELVFSETPGTCGWMQATGKCGRKANLVAVAAGIMRLNDGGGLPPAIGPGSYPLSFGTRDGSNITAAQWAWVKTNATCVNPGESVEPTGGTLTLESVSRGFVTGQISATFADGSWASGSFSAPVCEVAWDICADCPEPRACVQ